MYASGLISCRMKPFNNHAQYRQLIVVILTSGTSLALCVLAFWCKNKNGTNSGKSQGVIRLSQGGSPEGKSDYPRYLPLPHSLSGETVGSDLPKSDSVKSRLRWLKKKSDEPASENLPLSPRGRFSQAQPRSPGMFFPFS